MRVWQITFALCALMVVVAAEVDSEAILERHNQARRSVSNPAPSSPLYELRWNSSLANSAQAWAEKCIFAHSYEPFLGENLALGISGVDAVDMWVAEKDDYKYYTNECAPGKVCGHYTQVVWNMTSEVGCGMALCSEVDGFSGSFELFVCQYADPGNYIGEQPYETCADDSCGPTETDFCPLSSTCTADCPGNCREAHSSACPVDFVCGVYFNGVDYIECGSCDSGLVCNDNTECVDPNTCGGDSAECDVSCGFHSNVCGTVESCGSCPTGSYCFLGECQEDHCGGCGVNEYCVLTEDPSDAYCACLDGFKKSTNFRGCTEITSGQNSFHWETVSGNDAWNVLSNTMINHDVSELNTIRWKNSAQFLADDTTYSVSVAGLTSGDLAVLGLRNNADLGNSITAKFHVKNDGDVHVDLCLTIGGHDTCIKTGCTYPWPTEGTVALSARGRITEDFYEVHFSVGGDQCSTYSKIPIDLFDVRFTTTEDLFFSVQSDNVVAVSNAQVFTTTTFTVELQDCILDSQFVQWASAELGIDTSNIDIIDTGDAAERCSGNRKRGEAFVGGASALTFAIRGAPAASSSAVSAKLFSGVQSGSVGAAGIGGGIQSLSVANGLSGAALGLGPGAGAAASGATFGAAAAGGGGGGAAGGLTTGGIIGLSVGLPLAFVVVVGSAAAAGVVTYTVYEKNNRGDANHHMSTRNSEPGTNRRSLSQRIRGFFGVNVMGNEPGMHQSITARAPPMKT